MALSGGAAGTSNGNNANSSSSGGGGLEHGIEMESLHHRFHNHPHLQQQLLQQQQQQLFDGGGSGGGGAMGGSSGPGIGPGTVSGSLAGGSVTGGIAGIGGSGGGTPKPKRAAVTKKLQFSTPEYSETSIPAVPVVVSRLTPSRKREEAIVMANLRKRVAACDLTRKRPTPEDQNANEPENEQLDNRPLLPKNSSKRDLLSGTGSEDTVVKTPPVLQDKDFVLDCLCWHNEYRARHSAPALVVSPGLCEHAQQWANHLAQANEFYYRPQRNLGQNLFCCPISALVTDLTGQEVASYWYSTVRRYNYFKDANLLHTNVNAGHFTQMVWVATKYFGVGKATSHTGKIFVVAYYYPPGNIVNAFHENVLLPPMDEATAAAAAAAGAPKSDADNNPITSILKSS